MSVCNPEALLQEFIEAKGKKERKEIFETVQRNTYLFSDKILQRFVEADTRDGLSGNYAVWFRRIIDIRRRDRSGDSFSPALAQTA